MSALLLPRLLAGAVLALAANSACAQYAWIDDKGVKQFSDRPPPASVPSKNILKQPGTASTAAPSADAAPHKPPAPTLEEREADFRKRAQEKADRERKAGEQARQHAARQQACAIARANLARLNTGERIRSSAAKGERVLMDDAERAREVAAAQRTLGACR